MLTIRDVVDRLTVYGGDSPSYAQATSARRAAVDALREVGNAHEWTYLTRQGRLATSAPSKTGTIAYDHTGGSSERLVTLTGSTWPDWAADGVLAVSNVVYEVDRLLTSTTLTLTSASNPGADVAAGTSYSLYRDGYPLPRGVRKLGTVTSGAYTDMVFAQLSDLNYLNRRYVSAGVPRFWSCTGSADYLGEMSLFLSPFPDQVYPVDFTYVRHPREPLILDYSDGTVTCTQGSATVTGSGTAFASDMVGSVIRFSSSASLLPTDQSGGNRYAEERSVASVDSATQLTLDAAVSATRTAVRYMISDPVDLDPVALNAYLRCAEKHYCYARRMNWTSTAEGLYQNELVRACGADSRAMGRSGAKAAFIPRLRDMPRGSDVTG